MRRSITTLLTLLVWMVACRAPAPPVDAGLVITNVRILDGSGAPAFAGSVRIADGLIVAVGELEYSETDRTFDGRGLTLTPGFIDTHSHADTDIFEHPDAIAAMSQGITTVVVGQDGRSPFPLRDFQASLERMGTPINFASYVGHNTLRSLVMGADYERAAGAEELSSMQKLLREELSAGAIGLSTGLEYDPGIYSSTEEVIALAQLTAEEGGRYISHMRSEDRWLDTAVDELLHIGRVTKMPVHISHFKLAMKSLWGRADDFVQRLDAARREGINVTADVYPYEYWQSTMMVLLPERDPADMRAVQYALEELAPPEGMWFTRFAANPAYVGMRLSEIAALREVDATTAFSELAIEAQRFAAESGESAEAIIGTSMHSDDVRTLLAWPFTNIATDGGLVDLHPRASGSFPKVLGHYVREDGALALPDAVRKMTSLAAKNMGFVNRGYVREGYAADLVLFDPDTIVDRATPDAPRLLSTGVSAVWVDGQLIFANGRSTESLPGRFIRRSGAN
ncbi:MAG: D-aminoacylase [Pseudomonadota bacterium]